MDHSYEAFVRLKRVMLSDSDYTSRGVAAKGYRVVNVVQTEVLVLIIECNAWGAYQFFDVTEEPEFSDFEPTGRKACLRTEQKWLLAEATKILNYRHLTLWRKA